MCSRGTLSGLHCGRFAFQNGSKSMEEVALQNGSKSTEDLASQNGSKSMEDAVERQTEVDCLVPALSTLDQLSTLGVEEEGEGESYGDATLMVIPLQGDYVSGTKRLSRPGTNRAWLVNRGGRQGPLSSEYGTHKTIKARFQP